MGKATVDEAGWYKLKSQTEKKLFALAKIIIHSPIIYKTQKKLFFLLNHKYYYKNYFKKEKYVLQLYNFNVMFSATLLIFNVVFS